MPRVGVTIYRDFGEAKAEHPAIARARAVLSRDPAAANLLDESTHGLTLAVDGFASSARRHGAQILPSRLAAILPHAADDVAHLSAGGVEAWSITLRPRGFAHVLGQVDRGRVIYENVAPHTHLLATSGERMVEQILVLEDSAAPSTFDWDLEIGRGLKQRPEPLSTGAIDFLDANGDAALRIERPYAIDDKGTRVLATIRVENDAVHVQLDTRGLTYPIVLDPVTEVPVWQAAQGATSIPSYEAMAFDPNTNTDVVVGWDYLTHSASASSAFWGTVSDCASSGVCVGLRFNQAMATAGSSGVLLFGGYVYPANSASGDAWLYNGTWTNICASGACNYQVASGSCLWTSTGCPCPGDPTPPPTSGIVPAMGGNVFAGGPTAASLGTGNSLGAAVMVGTDGNTYFFHPGASPPFVANNGPNNQYGLPTPRSGACIAGPTKSGKMVMFGGGTDSSQFSDTWTLDVTGTIPRWSEACGSQVEHGCALPARMEAGCAYDATRDKVIAFGGKIGWLYGGDTWQYDETANDWILLEPSVPSMTRKLMGMAYDPGRKRIVMAGGANSSPQTDTWTFYERGGSCASNSDCDTGICNVPKTPSTTPATCCETVCGECQTCVSPTETSPILSLGCFAQPSSGFVQATIGMSGPRECWQACAALGHNSGYSGLSNGGACACGDTLNTAATSTGCSMSCSIDADFRCGGVSSHDVYQVSGETYKGCYSSATDGLTAITNGYLPSTCIASCRASGYGYAALAKGGECWCGNALPSTAPSISCTTGCFADGTQTCGGSASYQVYNSTSSGTCVSVPAGGTDPTGACTGSCNGSGACKLANGSTCASPSDCGSGFCATNGAAKTCCSTACTGSGLSCADATGTCLRDNGQACLANAECASNDCVDGRCCNSPCAGACDVCAALGGATADGVCTIVPARTAGNPSCGSGLACDGVHAICPPSCTSSSSCVTGDYCTIGGTCAALLTNGSTCTGGSQCASGNCQDNVCCNTPCSGGCDSCAGGTGVCTIVSAGTIGANPSCGVYVCDGSSAVCPTTCTSDAGCSIGQYCDAAGHCSTQKSPAAACNGAAGADCLVAGCRVCPGGGCVDGYCCDTACSGQCQACDVSGHLGTCTTLANDTTPHGTRASCAPYLCTGSATCASICASDADCVEPDNYCTSAGVCTARRVQGSTCNPAIDCKTTSCVECQTGDCVDGYCCNSACGGSCQACDVTGSAGTCAPILVDTSPHGSRTSCSPYLCEGGSTCPAGCSKDQDCVAGNYCKSGSCVAQVVNGVSCAAADQCSSGNCVDGYCCNTNCSSQCQACDVSGSLGACTTIAADAAPHGTRATCSPYLCEGAAACPSGCSKDGDCTAGNYCKAGVCVVQLGNGSLCGAVDQCSSGKCVDGVCCNTACMSQCQACNVAGNVGTCVSTVGPVHPNAAALSPSVARAACAGSGKCGASCDGVDVANCHYTASGSPCGVSASCTAGIATPTGACDGSGTCNQGTSTCVPYVCGTTTCKSTCASDADCAVGLSGAVINYCKGGACLPSQNNGSTCT
ncbi:MAG: hypothetical protein ACHREM_16045, partial [Polyangiales bacterium]